jgi:hypothetical protein
VSDVGLAMHQKAGLASVLHKLVMNGNQKLRERSHIASTVRRFGAI